MYDKNNSVITVYSIVFFRISLKSKIVLYIKSKFLPVQTATADPAHGANLAKNNSLESSRQFDNDTA